MTARTVPTSQTLGALTCEATCDHLRRSRNETTGYVRWNTLVDVRVGQMTEPSGRPEVRRSVVISFFYDHGNLNKIRRKKKTRRSKQQLEPRTPQLLLVRSALPLRLAPLKVHGAVTFVIIPANNRTDCHPIPTDLCLRSDKDPAVG